MIPVISARLTKARQDDKLVAWLQSSPAFPGLRHAHHDLPTGVRVHVAEAGPEDAPPVLCLHGWPQHFLIWRHLWPVLAASGG